MAITLRGRKGTPLTQDELDINFTEFFHSASVNGSEVVLHRFHYDSSSANPSASIQFPIDPPKGGTGFIQLKKGENPTGDDATLTASANLTFDYSTSNLLLTGSGNISGDLIVGGTVTAQEFKSELVSSSIVFESGSTKFGDTADDSHNFTGSLNVLGDSNIVGALSITGVPNVRTSIDLLDTTASLHEGEINQLQTDSGSFSTRVTDLEQFSSSLDTTFTTDAELNTSSSTLTTELNTSSSALTVAYTAADTTLSSSFASERLLNTTDTLNGNLTVTGTITAQEFNTEYISSSVIYESGSTKFGDSADDTHTFTGSVDILGRLGITGFTDVSASLAAAVASSGIQNVVEDITPQLGGNLDLNTNSISGSGTINIGGGITSSGLLTVTGTGTSQFSSHLQAHCLGIGTAPSGTTGEIRAAGDITAYYSSDERLKDNITPISDAINKINQIGGYEFDWNSDSSHSGHDVGVIAQEIEKVLPEVVVDRDTGYKAVRYEKIVALLIQAVKEQQLQIDELKSKL